MRRLLREPQIAVRMQLEEKSIDAPEGEPASPVPPRSHEHASSGRFRRNRLEVIRDLGQCSDAVSQERRAGSGGADDEDGAVEAWVQREQDPTYRQRASVAMRLRMELTILRDGPADPPGQRPERDLFHRTERPSPQRRKDGFGGLHRRAPASLQTGRRPLSSSTAEIGSAGSTGLTRLEHDIHLEDDIHIVAALLSGSLRSSDLQKRATRVNA